MALFPTRERDHLRRALARDLRLLLPEDPGREGMLEYVRLFDPRARKASGGRIDVWDSREIYLTRGAEITPDVAAEAGIPGTMTAAYFVQNLERPLPFSTSGGINSKKELRDASVKLMNGLAVRLGGEAWPEAPVLEEPLEARVYTDREISADLVFEAAAKYARGLAEYENPTFGAYGVRSWRTGDGQFEAHYWPKGTVHALRPHAPRSIGELFYHRSEAWAARLKLQAPANVAEPETARLLGKCALEIAGAAGGVCVDQLGFRVARPEELVFG